MRAKDLMVETQLQVTPGEQEAEEQAKLEILMARAKEVMESQVQSQELQLHAQVAEVVDVATPQPHRVAPSLEDPAAEAQVVTQHQLVPMARQTLAAEVVGQETGIRWQALMADRES